MLLSVKVKWDYSRRHWVPGQEIVGGDRHCLFCIVLGFDDLCSCKMEIKGHTLQGGFED